MKRKGLKKFRVGVDVGGTFTDFFIYDDETKQISVTKTSSTPENPAEGIIEGLKRSGIELKNIMFILMDRLLELMLLSHGTFPELRLLQQRISKMS